MITLPGLIDPHVHFRTPGQTHKEDFITGTKAALVGGYTMVLDMPNNLEPITTLERLQNKKKIAKKQILCDVGFYFGSLGDNLEEFEKLIKYSSSERSKSRSSRQARTINSQVFGLKLFLNLTTGGFIIDNKILLAIYNSWSLSKPILVHAEDDVIDLVIKVCAKTKKKTHVCHISTIESFKKIIKAKKSGLPITCGVTPHHLFLTPKDVKKLGPFGLMKPRIDGGFPKFAFKNLKWIDCVESDHAPHTKAEKKSKEPPFGVPGLETTLGLLLTAYSERKLTIKDIVRLCHEGPAQVFEINPLAASSKGGQAGQGKIIVDENEEWIVRGSNLQTKCKWSPFEGRTLKGRVKKVYIRNKLVFDNGKFLVKPGSGRLC